MSGTNSLPSPRILVVGYHAFDVIVPMAGLPRADQKHEIPRMFSGGGGPAATAAFALGRLGAKVRLVTPLTGDVAGRQQREELTSAGVDLSLCPTLEGHESPRAVILVDEARGHRTVLWSRGGLPRLAGRTADPRWLDGMDLLYVDGHEWEISLPLTEAARQRGLPVVMDAGSVREGSSDLVARCTDVVSSQGFAPELTGQAQPLEALRALRGQGPERVGMTFGAEGVLGLWNDQPVVVPAFDVPVTDTTGAGDAFHAGYAFARARGLDFETCLDWGCAVAGLKCRDWGGRRGLPTLPEVLELLKTGVRVNPELLQARLRP